MGKMIAKRILQAVPMILAISIFSFMLMRFAPGEPYQAYITPEMMAADIEQIKENMGVDEPIHIQYASWLKEAVQGNMGYSLLNHRSVVTQIGERLPATIGLMAAAMAISMILGILIGLLSAAYRNRFLDRLLTFLSYVGISIPSAWFAMMLMYFFSLKLGWLPAIGMRSVGVRTTWDLIKHAIMPVAVLSIGNIGTIARFVRSSTITQMGEEYVTVALAAGASRREVIYRYVLKNSILPVITLIGMSLPSLVTGSFIVESIFGWPGLGQLGMNAVLGLDYPLIMATTMFSSLLLILGNLLSDILYGIADPRIKELN